MVPQLRQFAKKSKTMIIANKIYSNWLMKRQFGAGNPESLHGSTHSTIIKDLSQSIGYINAQFEDYLEYSGLMVEDLRGMRVFELGFGDNVGVALKFIAAGVEQAVCLDKFYSKRDLEQQRRIYLALRETILDEDSRRRFDEAINLSSSADINPARIKCIYGTDVEDAAELKNIKPFELVISRGAIQDIYQPDAAFDAMDRILAPGGYMLHKVDLSDQGMFREKGMNPLMYLTISDRVYGLMAIDSGRPNRKLRSYYSEVMERLGYDTKILVTDIIGVGVPGTGNLHPHKEEIKLKVDYTDSTLQFVRDIRPRLIPRFKGLSDEELIVDGIFIVARKPD